MLNKKLTQIVDDEFMKLFTNGIHSMSTATKQASLSTSDFLQTWKDISVYAEPALNIISSVYCYKTIIKAVGTRSKLKPNTRRPLYKNKSVIIPLAYRIGNQIICHPSIEEKLRRGMEIQVRVVPKDIRFDLQYRPFDMIEEKEDSLIKFKTNFDWRIGLYNPVKYISGS